jgi:leucyl/phenylalanyl-tRNA---protein transferase
MITWLNPGDAFPHASTALVDPNGLVCAGLELTAERVLAAYERGIFPWYSEGQPVLWWSPDPRMVLLPENFKLHRSLKKVLRNTEYEIRVDENFEDVMRGCAELRPDQGGTWITDSIIAAYSNLHRVGVAHCVECWMDGELAGGLYGIALGRVFFGESMFMRRTDGSKIAFAHLVTQLAQWGFALIDCQQETEHLASFGARPISRENFLQALTRLIHSDASVPRIGRWQFTVNLRHDVNMISSTVGASSR